ncbi:MAG: outer membrane lipoprotein LolB [Dechloromonas sp.]|nr:MAG: outer membrane lipoprotein LolB [Dechloromonas sp.]
MRGLLFALAALLAGCASAPLTTTLERDAVQGFEMSGRFSLRVEAGNQPAQSASGRLEWTHRPPVSQLLIANPLGHAVAELDIAPDRSRLRLADGSQRESNDPEELIATVTGRRLPLTRLPDWLLGRGDGTAQRLNDPLGRPLQLREAGWQIDYDYDEARPGAPPARLTVRRSGDLELRLRIEEWKASP